MPPCMGRAFCQGATARAQIPASGVPTGQGDAAPDLPDPVVPDHQHTRLELKQVLQALDQRPEAQRKPIILIALREMSYAEATRSLDVPLGTFMSRLGRGREALRQIVSGLGKGKLSVLKRKGSL